MATTPPPPAARTRGWARLAACVLAGVMVFTSFPFTTSPASNIFPLTWVALIPFFWALDGVSRRKAFALGALFGFVTNLGGFWWISIVLRDFGHLSAAVGWFGASVNAAYQGLQLALFAYLFVRIRGDGRRLNLFYIAALYVVVEFFFPMLFPWYLGNSQYRFLPAIQIADIAGVMGVTFVIVAFNLALYRVVEWRLWQRALPRRQVIGALALTALTLMYGGLRLAMTDSAVDDAEKLKVAIIEADIGIWDKQSKGMTPRQRALTLHRNLLVHQNLSAQAERDAKPDLIIWPESSYFPLDDVSIKRTDGFAIGLEQGGRLSIWRDVAGAKPTWAAAPQTLDAEGPWRAVHAETERAWAAVGDGGRAAHFDGQRVIPLITGTTADLLGVAVVSDAGRARHADGAPVVIWAVGANGTIVTGPPTGLAVVPTPTTATLRAIAMRTSRTGYAVGDGGTLLDLKGATVQPVEIAGDADLHAVWTDPQRARSVAVGASGVVVIRDEREWTRHVAPTDATLRAVIGDDARRIWAAGDRGEIWARADDAWRRDTSPTTETILSLAADGWGGLLVADAAGGLFHRAADAPWRALPARPDDPLIALSQVPWTRVSHLPRDMRYIYQSRAPLPTLEAYDADPLPEFMGSRTADRTAVQRGFKTPMIFGGITVAADVEGQPRTKYNTATMLDGDGRIVGMYDKVYLLLFGEYMPFGDTFPELYDLFANAGRFTPGSEVRAFDWRGHKIGVMICYEDILAKFTGRLAAQDPNVIINVTNDAWFGTSSEPYLHLALAVFRSVENRLPLVRATNTGVSAVVDPSGRIVGQTALTGAETLISDVPLMEGGTLYSRLGDVFSYGATLAVLFFGWRRRRRRRRAPPADAGAAA